MSAAPGPCMSAAAAALVTAISLPLNVFWANVAPAGGTLLVSGYADRGPGCVFLRVDARTVHFARAHGNCSRTGHLTPEVRPNPRSPWQKVFVGGGRAFASNDG